MLRRLLIRDFAIVDALELDFPDGFGVLTGETGAGKSILVDALALALGERAEASDLRPGADRADVSAAFELAEGSAPARWLAEHDFPPDEQGCLLRRVIEAGGRSRGYINGAAATAAQMRALGELLVDIHGQHAHHVLLRAEAQRALLDAHGGLAAQARRVAALHQDWRRLTQARREAEQGAEAMARERATLDWQLKELAELAFEPRQWLELGQEHRRLANAADLLAGAAETLEAIDEGEYAVGAQLARAAARLAALAEYDRELAEGAAMLESAQAQTAEAAHLLRRYRDRLDLDPQRLAEVEARLEAVHRAARKHRVVPEDLPGLLAQLRQRRDELAQLADPQALAEAEQRAAAACREAAEALSRGRREAAADLAAQVSAAMQELAMAGGRFEVALEPLAEAASHGLETVEFCVAAHAQQPLRPLAKVASGGELSRIGLAIQVIASVRGEAQTLIFDEVDVGIGGRVAEIVGRLLKRIGARRQVLCVTHLPQVAAQADWQWSIAKEARGAGVASRVTALDAGGRVEEIARMLGGVEVTAATRRHAQELLARVRA
jgi:DNA repair protein RecN (Recombination protein N)